MKTINVDLSSGEALNLLVGRQGESGVTQVVFDFSALKTEFGTGTVSLSVKRPKESTPYAQTITTSGTNATWLVNETDTGVAGCGEIQLTYTVNSQIAKTVVYKYTVYPSIGVDGEYPIPGQTWQQEIEEDIADIKQDLSDLQAEIEGGGSGLTADLKAALDQLAQKVAYIDDDGQDYYDALHNALYPVTPPATLSYITAIYTQSGTVYDTDTLNSLKSDLVVTAHYTGGTSEVVTNYTLSGTLTEGTSTITVAYGGKTTTFNVIVSAYIDTTAQIEFDGYVLEHKSSGIANTAKTNGGITIKYQMDAPTTTLYPAGIIPVTDNVIGNGIGSLVAYDEQGNIVNYLNEWTTQDQRWAQNPNGTLVEFSQSWTIGTYTQIAFSVDTRYLNNAYMYDKTTGKVFFAGVNTPYYGMRNISEAQ